MILGIDGPGTVRRGHDTPPRAARSYRSAGIALVIVLWAVMLLSGLAVGLMGTVRGEIDLARNLGSMARARALADAAIHLAVYELLTAPVDEPADGAPEGGGRSLIPGAAAEPATRELAGSSSQDDRETLRVGGPPRPREIDGQRVLIAVEAERGKIDLNVAPAELIEAAFRSVVDGQTASAWTDAVMRHRAVALGRDEPDSTDDLARDNADGSLRPFQSVHDLATVTAMPREAFHKLARLFTVYSGEPTVRLEFASRAVAAVVAAARGLEAGHTSQSADSEASGAEAAVNTFPVPQSDEDRHIYTIRAEARDGDGSRFVREAVVELTGSAERPFLIFGWQQAWDREWPE